MPAILKLLPLAAPRFAAWAFAFAFATVAGAADDAASLLRGDPQYVRKVTERDFAREFAASPVFFPPDPPPLGAPIDRIRPLYDLKWLAPAEMAQFVSEPFYPRLAMLMASDTLDNITARRIDAYRDERVALRKALEERLAELQDATPAVRLRELEALARLQTPRLAELEREAERLRGDLASPLLLRSERERRRNRAQGIGRGEKGRTWEYEIVRYAAFLLDGLAPAQRRLLREAAMELDDRSELDPRAAAKSKAETRLHFSPDTSVIILPPDLPAGLAAELNAYQAEKTVLKRQLRDLIYALDDARSELDAVRDARTFAQKQAPQIAALEARAEELRGSLAARWQARRSPVPPHLARRLASYHAERKAAEAELVSRVASAKKPLLTYTGQRNPDSLPRDAVIPKMDNRNLPRTEEFQALTGHAPTNRTRALYKVVHVALEDARKQFASRLAELDATKQELIQELARAAGSANGSTANAGSEALAAATTAFESYEAEHRLREDYASYAAAVFEPGLSPEQRRLLLDGAVQKLALPLPGGSFWPWPTVR